MTRIFLFAAIYFSVVFGAGFCLGIVRVMFLEDLLGARWAELIEMPFMFAVMLVAAIRIMTSKHGDMSNRASIGVGAFALLYLVVAELSLVLVVRKITLQDYFSERDPISGTVYIIMLGVFALLPWMVHQGRFFAKSK